jgi:hypothetical protein
MFHDYREYSLSLACICVLLMVAGRFDRLAPRAQKVGLTGLTAISLAAFGLLAMAVGQIPTTKLTADPEKVLAADRNFYGPLRIFEVNHKPPVGRIRVMAHGATVHGFQYADPLRRRTSTSYYDTESGFGLAIDSHRKRLAGAPLKLGVIGLGVGTIAAYTHRDDTCVFYEINPFVIRYCREYFTFVDDAVARGAIVDMRLGDARLVMERELTEHRAGGYDILAIDAFSSDAIPIHLLTRECLSIYWRHLDRNGVLAFHVSNRYLDLRPIIYRHALDRQATALSVNRSVVPEERNSKVAYESDWVLVTQDMDLADRLAATGRTVPYEPRRSIEAWTDDFSSLFDVLR